MTPGVLVFRKTEKLVAPKLATHISGLPSPSMSPMSMPTGCVAAVKSTFAAKEIDPTVLVFRNTDTLVEVMFVTAMSGLPSPSMSPTATLRVPVPAVRSILAANEGEPTVLVFLRTDTVPAVLLDVARSTFPSPSKSAIAAC